jgi:hypothetical protein
MNAPRTRRAGTAAGAAGWPRGGVWATHSRPARRRRRGQRVGTAHGKSVRSRLWSKAPPTGPHRGTRSVSTQSAFMNHAGRRASSASSARHAPPFRISWTTASRHDDDLHLRPHPVARPPCAALPTARSARRQAPMGPPPVLLPAVLPGALASCSTVREERATDLQPCVTQGQPAGAAPRAPPC